MNINVATLSATKKRGGFIQIKNDNDGSSILSYRYDEDIVEVFAAPFVDNSGAYLARKQGEIRTNTLLSERNSIHHVVHCIQGDSPALIIVCYEEIRRQYRIFWYDVLSKTHQELDISPGGDTIYSVSVTQIPIHLTHNDMRFLLVFGTKEGFAHVFSIEATADNGHVVVAQKTVAMDDKSCSPITAIEVTLRSLEDPRRGYREPKVIVGTMAGALVSFNIRLQEDNLVVLSKRNLTNPGTIYPGSPITHLQSLRLHKSIFLAIGQDGSRKNADCWDWKKQASVRILKYHGNGRLSVINTMTPNDSLSMCEIAAIRFRESPDGLSATTVFRETVGPYALELAKTIGEYRNHHIQLTTNRPFSPARVLDLCEIEEGCLLLLEQELVKPEDVQDDSTIIHAVVNAGLIPADANGTFNTTEVAQLPSIREWSTESTIESGEHSTIETDCSESHASTEIMLEEPVLKACETTADAEDGIFDDGIVDDDVEMNDQVEVRETGEEVVQADDHDYCEYGTVDDVDIFCNTEDDMDFDQPTREDDDVDQTEDHVTGSESPAPATDVIEPLVPVEEEPPEDIRTIPLSQLADILTSLREGSIDGKLFIDLLLSEADPHYQADSTYLKTHGDALLGKLAKGTLLSQQSHRQALYYLCLLNVDCKLDLASFTFMTEEEQNLVNAYTQLDQRSYEDAITSLTTVDVASTPYLLKVLKTLEKHVGTEPINAFIISHAIPQKAPKTCIHYLQDHSLEEALRYVETMPQAERQQGLDTILNNTCHNEKQPTLQDILYLASYPSNDDDLRQFVSFTSRSTCPVSKLILMHIYASQQQYGKALDTIRLLRATNNLDAMVTIACDTLEASIKEKLPALMAYLPEEIFMSNPGRATGSYKKFFASNGLAAGPRLLGGAFNSIMRGEKLKKTDKDNLQQERM